MSNMPKPDEWNEWSRYVLNELERANQTFKEIRIEQTQMRMDFLTGISAVRNDFHASTQNLEIELATLKVKSGVWGLIGGAIPVAVGLLVWLATTYIK